MDKHSQRIEIFNSTLKLIEQGWYITSSGEEMELPPMEWTNREGYKKGKLTRAAIVYSLFSSCKAHNVDVRSWLEDTLKRIPAEKDIDQLLSTTSRHYRVLPQ